MTRFAFFRKLDFDRKAASNGLRFGVLIFVLFSVRTVSTCGAYLTGAVFADSRRLVVSAAAKMRKVVANSYAIQLIIAGAKLSALRITPHMTIYSLRLRSKFAIHLLTKGSFNVRYRAETTPTGFLLNCICGGGSRCWNNGVTSA